MEQIPAEVKAFFKRQLPERFWGGFSDGKLYFTLDKFSELPIHAIYTRKKDAEKDFEDVRELVVFEA